jgi:hypothetical protein
MYAKVPKEHSLIIPNLPEVPSLMQACVSVIWREGIPWRLYEEQLGGSCVAALKNGHLFYEVPPVLRSRSKRQPAVTANEKIFLGSGTIIVCPPNLVEQWRTEIAKHVEDGRLKVLVMAHTSARLPPVRELLEYDIVLFSRTCFDLEEREGKDARGRRESGGVPLSCSCPYIGATRTPDCRCFKKDGVYKSPLFGIRWKRLIVDEGHSMGGSGKTNAVCVAEKLSVEARWLVSGTPSPSLLGAGVGAANIEGETEAESRERRDKLLNARKEFQAREAQDLDRLGKIVRDFFRLQPWAAAKDRGTQVRECRRGRCVPDITKVAEIFHPGVVERVHNARFFGRPRRIYYLRPKHIATPDGSTQAGRHRTKHYASPAIPQACLPETQIYGEDFDQSLLVSAGSQCRNQ